jgi:hypothetical protein
MRRRSGARSRLILRRRHRHRMRARGSATAAQSKQYTATAAAELGDGGGCELKKARRWRRVHPATAESRPLYGGGSTGEQEGGGHSAEQDNLTPPDEKRRRQPDCRGGRDGGKTDGEKKTAATKCNPDCSGERYNPNPKIWLFIPC